MCRHLSGSIKFFLILVLASCTTTNVAPLKPDSALAKAEVLTAANQPVKLQDLMGQNGLVVISHKSDCPIVRRYSSEVEKINALLRKKKINVIYLNAAASDSSQKIASHMIDYRVGVPIYRDPAALLTKDLKMGRTSEAVLLTPRYETVYRGAIDDSLDYEAGKIAQHRYLLDAVSAFEDKRPIAVPQTEARGCIIE